MQRAGSMEKSKYAYLFPIFKVRAQGGTGKRALFMLKVIEGGLQPHKQVVLVVDDEPVIRMATVQHLEEAGFAVREAASAFQAIVVLRDQDNRVDLVFSDVRMPGHMDGVALSCWIFKNRPNIPVILASGDIGKAIALEDLCGAETMQKPL